MGFSGGLQITDLNDFITPGQECIKPVKESNQPAQTETAPEPAPDAPTTQISIGENGEYFEQNQKLEKAEITLNDCLACSGCITSAETVLIESQSHKEVQKYLSSTSDKKTMIASIAPQTLASISASLGSTPSNEILLRRLRHQLKDIGFDYVFDTTFSRHLSLVEIVNEFNSLDQSNRLLLTSACPGWICYVEKTHGELIPFISTTKSPQQIMGSLVKYWFSQHINKTPSDVYHVTIMPCYDKKLEASRQDFYSDLYQTRDVDCVLTSGEIGLLFDTPVNLEVNVPNENSLSFEEQVIPHHIQHPGTSSGSYLENILNLLRLQTPNLRLETHSPRNLADSVEYLLINDENECVFKGAKCYGFKNIQNLVRKVGKERGVSSGRGAAGRMAASRGRVRTRNTGNPHDSKTLDFVEVMACPSGCINGGGQLKPGISTDKEGNERDWDSEGVAVNPSKNIEESVRWSTKNWIGRVEDIYWRASEDSKTLTVSQVDAKAGEMLAALAKEHLRTEYHAVESETSGLAVQWSDRREYLVVGFTSIVALSTLYAMYKLNKEKKKKNVQYSPIIIEDHRQIADGLTDLIGNTPLIRIPSLSNALGVDILGKCEFMNPGGSVKDRVALRIIQDAEDRGDLAPHTNSCIFEGTVGSTGISIAMVSKAKGYRADDVSAEKADLLVKLGAEVEKVRPASIIDKKQFVNLAKVRASQYTERTDKAVGYFADQFERLSNWHAHYDGTAPEIWKQTEDGQFSAFVSGAGTGGTISGCATYFKQRNSNIKTILADPEGSGLYNRVKYGVMFASQEKEGTKRRHQVDSIVEGIGINRLTANFEQGLEHINDAVRVSDEEAVAMSRYIMANDGLFLGSSSACNLVAAVRSAKKMEKGSSIVTILCDSGGRHLSRFWDDSRLEELGIKVRSDIYDIIA
ncbi:hypothetical protein E3P89_03725 [Wallemia ichthyophaga]|uniref:Cytosolic Fe-S cluster assembly factor NAR1 n=1 Tax=Wallemia ichthyophaga TaxID=245174 RepID=A0A4T0H3R3_WALIC|nr:hypothetical protein E3P93_03738 [Wallemia ichthyophaga]TIB08245.1 hypothetical protein E3P90_03767 [Wallemia ichthyophaga]TIB19713.1 hypothetical protein E3P89_03725 [Wallemia ichthyophaga]TIB20855.1 hypothetical protein E3P88_03753 [Wallemia ichthyophaga]